MTLLGHRGIAREQASRVQQMDIPGMHLHAFFGVSRPITDESHAIVRTTLTESLTEIRLKKVSYICISAMETKSATKPSLQATNARQRLLLLAFQGVAPHVSQLAEPLEFWNKPARRMWEIWAGAEVN